MPILKLAVDWQSLYLIQLDFFSTVSYLAQPVLNLAERCGSRTASVSYQLIVLWVPCVSNTYTLSLG